MTNETQGKPCCRKKIQCDCLDAAQQFFRTADHLNLATEMYPKIALLAFSCELFIKAILLCTIEMKDARGHDLKSLFEMLPDETKETFLSKWSSKYEKNFKEVLNENSRVFEQWRYAYEEEKIPAEVTDLENLAIFLKKNAESTTMLCLY